MRSNVPADAEHKLVLGTIADSLHAMCQPLTALQCLLELGRTNDVQAGEAAVSKTRGESWEERLFEESLQECVRLNALVVAMRTTVQQALGEE